MVNLEEMLTILPRNINNFTKKIFTILLRNVDYFTRTKGVKMLTILLGLKELDLCKLQKIFLLSEMLHIKYEEKLAQY